MFRLCDQVAAGSDDPHRKVVFVIINDDGAVVATGTNKFPEGCGITESRLEKPEKYFWIEHAERNAIYAAAKEGISLQGTTMFINWWPCVDCTRAIIQCGIGKIVARRRPDFDHPRWGPHFRTSFQMIEEHGNIHTTFTEES